MAFTQSDFSKLQTLLSSSTSSADSVGKIMRDVKLLLRLNPAWSVGVRTYLNTYVTQCESWLRDEDRFENDLAMQMLEEISSP